MREGRRTVGAATGQPAHRAGIELRDQRPARRLFGHLSLVAVQCVQRGLRLRSDQRQRRWTCDRLRRTQLIAPTMAGRSTSSAGLVVAEERPATATISRSANTDRNLCFEPPGNTASSNQCNDAQQNDCTIFSGAPPCGSTMMSLQRHPH